MAEDDAFVKSIPAFLRRPAENWPETPLFGIGTGPTGENRGTGDANPDQDVIALTPDKSVAAEQKDATSAEDFFARSRAEIARRLDAESETEAHDELQTIEIILPATVARALEARAEREGCDESVVVLAALRRMGLPQAARRGGASHIRRRWRRQRRRA